MEDLASLYLWLSRKNVHHNYKANTEIKPDWFSLFSSPSYPAWASLFPWLFSEFWLLLLALWHCGFRKRFLHPCIRRSKKWNWKRSIMGWYGWKNHIPLPYHALRGNLKHKLHRSQRDWEMILFEGEGGEIIRKIAVYLNMLHQGERWLAELQWFLFSICLL